MSDIHSPARVWLVVAMFSRYTVALAWSREQLAQRYGTVALESPRFAFADTDYYAPTMGSGLFKQFALFERTIDPAALVGIKHQTNRLESAYASLGRHEEPRPLNVDPGYLTAAKLVLASTKDHAHRIYLDRGIYAEVTLHYHHGQWQPRDWTFPDYRRDDYRAFFTAARAYVRNHEHEGGIA